MAKIYSPTGEAYETNNKVELRRLLNRGYSETKPTPTQRAVASGDKAPTEKTPH